MRVLVTGGTGALGRPLVVRLRDRAEGSVTTAPNSRARG
jgi:nucleoside-diphosphate-sugar epimerase